MEKNWIWSINNCTNKPVVVYNPANRKKFITNQKVNKNRNPWYALCSNIRQNSDKVFKFHSKQKTKSRDFKRSSSFTYSYECFIRVLRRYSMYSVSGCWLSVRRDWLTWSVRLNHRTREKAKQAPLERREITTRRALCVSDKNTATALLFQTDATRFLRTTSDYATSCFTASLLSFILIHVEIHS